MASVRHFKIMNTEVIDILVSGATSSGGFTVFTETCPPGAGPPPHIHTREDEFMMPIEGSFELFFSERWIPLAGSGFYTERYNLHTWRNSGERNGTILFITSPGGFDKFLEDLVPVRMPEQIDQLISISAKYGISYPTLSP